MHYWLKEMLLALRRTMLKVSAEDEATASAMFELLMGDQVEPRKEFIQKHAADVRNLDI